MMMNHTKISGLECKQELIAFFCHIVRSCLMAIWFIKLKELLESLILVINLKRLLNVIKEWDTTWILCDSLHA